MEGSSYDRVLRYLYLQGFSKVVCEAYVEGVKMCYKLMQKDNKCCLGGDTYYILILKIISIANFFLFHLDLVKGAS